MLRIPSGLFTLYRFLASGACELSLIGCRLQRSLCCWKFLALCTCLNSDLGHTWTENEQWPKAEGGHSDPGLTSQQPWPKTDVEASLDQQPGLEVQPDVGHLLANSVYQARSLDDRGWRALITAPPGPGGHDDLGHTWTWELSILSDNSPGSENSAFGLAPCITAGTSQPV